ncbi:MAG: anhydro-N-acetylmuramic acid kinase, partial [Microcoleus sp.]
MVRVIGSISGTSVDGIDTALVDVVGSHADLRIEFLGGKTFAYPADLRSQILSVCAGEALSIAALAQLDDDIAREFATAALTIQSEYGKAELIGSHGQTVYHRPAGCGEQTTDGVTMGYSLQLGRGALIAELTGITTVSNFR